MSHGKEVSRQSMHACRRPGRQTGRLTGRAGRRRVAGQAVGVPAWAKGPHSRADVSKASFGACAAPPSLMCRPTLHSLVLL